MQDNTAIFFLMAGVLALTGIYFYASGLPAGAIVMVLGSIGFIWLGRFLRRRGSTSK